MEGLEPAAQTQELSQTYLGDAGGRGPHVLSIHQDVHRVICAPTDAHPAPHLGPRGDKQRGSATSPRHARSRLHRAPGAGCLTPSLSRFRP